LAVKPFAGTLSGEGASILPAPIRSLAAALALLSGLSAHALRADEDSPLRFTVGPSGAQGEETLDQKLARRDRFRFICIGCVRASGQVDGSSFRPIETLNAPELTRALAPPAPDIPPEGRDAPGD
jgi:hypothetical protein